MVSLINSNRGNPFYKLYYNKLKAVDKEDLHYVEKDLAFYEKASLSFLLYGSDLVNAQIALQQLLVLSHSQHQDSDMLYNYTKINPNWKEPLLEALAIIKANRVLRKLGFSVDELKSMFLPHHAEISLHIHPILKVLYVMCERLTVADAGKLILDVKEQYSLTNNLRFYDCSILEVFLLDWVTKSLITIGKWPDLSGKSQPNLDLILQFLKLNEKDLLKETLLNVIKNFNKKLNLDGTRPPAVTTTNCNENDSGATKNNKFERIESCNLNIDETYLVGRQSAGFVLIINQKEFYREKKSELMEYLPKKDLSERRGTDMDKRALKCTFSSFGYVPVEIDNCTHVDIIHRIVDIVKRSIIYDSLIVCILSHGIEGAVYGSNSIPVSIQNIQKLLAADTLLGKPKMLIIQACQGAEFQMAKYVDKLEYDAPETSIPAYSDMLTAMSTVPGFSSVRHTEKGTWFIQTLCRQIDELGNSKHMLEILTAVNRKVTTMRGIQNQCMVPMSSQTLNKNFYLPRRY